MTAERTAASGLEIRVGGLVCRLGTLAALHGVSVVIPAGILCGVAGPNGAGKTTLLRALAGALGREEGTVLVGGHDPFVTPPAALARVMAVLPQRPVAPAGLTARQAVAWGRDPHLGRLARPGLEDQRAVDAALDQTGTRALADRPVETLSGGELHRVLIARALAQEPRVLLLDEPTVHLDISHQVEIMQLLRRLAEEGRTIVVAIHDLNLAAAYCDRIALLAHGRLVAYGEPGDVIRPDLIQQAYGAAAVIRVNPATGRPYLVVASPPIRPAAGPRVHVICGGGTGAELLARCVQLGYRVTVGVVHVMDTDEETARSLGLEVIQEAPFSPLGDEAVEAAAQAARTADAVIVAPVPLGPGNLRNLEVAAAALGNGVPVIMVDGVGARDFAGGQAAAAASALIARGARLVPDLAGAVAALVRLAPVG
ncbi:MAG: ABC transporter ATP-binding protein [Armatimonadota bacterium]|nr:ABC transporter ATP-binding protein [Armatimonadota bacterium]